MEEIAREKQGGSKVNEVIELEAGVDAKGVGGENSNKSGARVTETVKRIASGTRRSQQSEDTGMSQQSEGTGVNQQSEGCRVGSSSRGARLRNSIASGARVGKQSAGCRASSSISDASMPKVKDIGAGVSHHSEVSKEVSGFNGGAEMCQGSEISVLATVQGRHEICNGKCSSRSGARERASCNVYGGEDFEEKMVEFVCGSGHCNIRSISFDLFGRARVLGFRDKKECRSGASFDSAGNESSSDKSNIVTKAGAMINNVDGGEAGEQNWRARKKAAMAMVKRSEVQNASSRVVLASMESVMAKGDSEAHGDWCWDIVINTVRCETRKVGHGCRGELRSRSGRRKRSSAKLRKRAGLRNVELHNAAEQREKQRTSAEQLT